MSTGRHRLPSPAVTAARALARSPLGITAVVVALVVAAAILVPVGLNALGCGEPRYLRVSTTQSMAPVLREAASEFNAGSPSYGGECVYAQVDEIAPHRIMSAISGGASDEATIAPHVWVPESSAWVELARVSAEGAHGIETDPPSLASSPVVLAAPADTEGLPDGDEAPWTTVLPGELDPDRPVVMVDPNRGADGMAVMHAVRDHLGTGDAADTDMTDFVRDVQQDSAFGEIDPAAFYSGSEAAQGPVEPLVVMPEQAVVEHNANGPESAPALEAYYPEEGTVGLDYPYVTTTEDGDLRSAAGDLYEVVAEEPYRTRIQALGFRDPDGSASQALEAQPGIVADEPELHGDLTGDALVDAVNDWNRLSMPSRALILADTSEHMEGSLSEGSSRIEAARAAAQTGLGLFPDETDMGLWTLSGELGEEGREESADLLRLDAVDDGSGEGEETTRRQELAEVAENIDVEGGESHLYDNMLAAFDEVQDNYHEDKINSVIMLTAGVDGGSSDIGHRELVETLQDRFDPERPVGFFIIAFGDGAEEAELQEIASATSGTAFVTDDPDEIGDIFLSSISRRLCVPDCD